MSKQKVEIKPGQVWCEKRAIDSTGWKREILIGCAEGGAWDRRKRRVAVPAGNDRTAKGATMRTIMMGLVLAAMMGGCATTGKVGPITNNYRKWYQSCGVERYVPGNIEVFKGQTPSPNTALATADQLPNPRSNVKGVLRVIIPHSECSGNGVEIADLIPEPAEITPAAAGPKVFKFKIAPVNPKDWNE